MFALNEDENMDTSDTPWHWYYQADCGRWHRFELLFDQYGNVLLFDIEKFYLSDQSFIENWLKCVCVFSRAVMLQTDLTTGKQRRIQRNFNLENRWGPVYHNSVTSLIPLDKRTPEYQDVAHYARHNGLLNETIVSITRIQNLDLWEMYCRKKKQLMRLKGTNNIQERRLFHGTDSENIASICTNNFDLRLAGQHGKLYGKGIYFTTYAFFANSYSTTTRALTNGKLTKVIFLARVMVGKSKPGEFYFCKPDHGSLENVHDSCVDDLDDPMIFIIFDPNQIYPEYLIEYEL
uniref:Poly [ADP-ribose] polymerase n=1 Tax=Poecilia latipinna TaxID=48699 RepID=A0A3B3V6Q3_9TELE